jgi:hypothetical protein
MDEYINLPIDRDELIILAQIAERECEAFFERNPHLIPLYEERLLAIALCQGAALQFIGKGYGVKDFDIHFFYFKNPTKPRLSRAVKRLWTDVGKFKNVQIDFIRTVIPAFPESPSSVTSQAEIIRRFLTEKATSNARHLSKKAVVGLVPNEILGTILWP